MTAVNSEINMDKEDLRRMNSVLRHRLRNVASGFRNAITLLARELETKLEPGQQEYFPLLLAECDDLSRITDRMSLFFDDQPFGMPEQLERLLDLLEAEHRAEFPGSPLELVCSESSRPLIVPDRNAFLIATKELIRNAVQARHGMAVAMTVRDENGLLIVEVFDQGKGLAPDFGNKAFKPFVTQRPRTLGLGLAIAQKFAERMGGTIKFDLAQSPGLHVFFEFPYVSADDSARLEQGAGLHKEGN